MCSPRLGFCITFEGNQPSSTSIDISFVTRLYWCWLQRKLLPIAYRSGEEQEEYALLAEPTESRGWCESGGEARAEWAWEL
jgi:hypothetical protein